MSSTNSPPDYLEFDRISRRVRLDPHEPRFYRDPYPAYAFLHRHARSFFWEEYGLWCFCGYDDVNGLLRDRRFGRQMPDPTDNEAAPDRSHLRDFDAVEAHSLLELEPPVHTRLRGLVNRAFVSRQIERLRPRIGEITNRLIDGFEDDESADLISAYATPVPITMITEMLGIPTDMAPDLLSWSHDMVKMYVVGPSDEAQMAANNAAREFSDYLRSYIRERKHAPNDDLLDRLISATEDGERLCEEELISSVILLLNAGHEATVHQTGNAVRTLLNQDDPGRFLSSPKRAAQAVEECLRIDAPLHMFTRYAYQTIGLNEDVVVQPGDQIGLMLGAANCDPEAFEQPRAFLPERQDQKNVSFGAGLHFCIGAPLARLEMQVSLSVLFERLPALKICEEPSYSDTFHFHGHDVLRVSW